MSYPHALTVYIAILNTKAAETAYGSLVTGLRHPSGVPPL